MGWVNRIAKAWRRSRQRKQITRSIDVEADDLNLHRLRSSPDRGELVLKEMERVLPRMDWRDAARIVELRMSAIRVDGSDRRLHQHANDLIRRMHRMARDCDHANRGTTNWRAMYPNPGDSNE